MLEAPKMFREQVVDPLHQALTRFSTELNQAHRSPQGYCHRGHSIYRESSNGDQGA
jgi:hypothetical protein